MAEKLLSLKPVSAILDKLVYSQLSSIPIAANPRPSPHVSVSWTLDVEQSWEERPCDWRPPRTAAGKMQAVS